MMNVSISVTIGFIFQSALFGAYQAMFLVCSYYILYGRRSEGVNRPFLIMAVVMWIFIVIHYSLSLSMAMESFIGSLPKCSQDSNGCSTYFSSTNNWKQVTRIGVYITLTAVADSLSIYRLYIVWGHNRRTVVAPMVLLCGGITSGIAIELINSRTTSRVFSPSLAGCAAAFFVSSLVQNLYDTFMIVYRIWRAHVSIAPEDRGRSLWPVIAIMLESGAIYSTALVVSLATYLAYSDVQYIGFDILVPIIGITFSMIIVRAGLGLSTRTSGDRDFNPPSTIVMTEFPQRNINILVSQTVTVEYSDSDMTGRAAESPTRELVVWRRSGEAVR